MIVLREVIQENCHKIYLMRLNLKKKKLKNCKEKTELEEKQLIREELPVVIRLYIPIIRNEVKSSETFEHNTLNNCNPKNFR